MKSKMGLGVYDLRETARFSGLNPRRVRRWFVQHPVLQSDYKQNGQGLTLSFLDLVDVVIFGQLRNHGVKLKTLKHVSTRLEKELKTRHPFAHSRLATDGYEIFLRGADSSGKDELVEVLTKQKVFPEIIAPFLKQLDYDQATQLASLWHIGRGVILNPKIAMGKPVVDGVFVKTEVLADAWKANNRDTEGVARWYNVSPDDVRRAVEFEQGSAA